MQLERRGFYPQGAGRAALTVQSLAPGSSLAAFDLTDRGSVTSITVRAFQAGQMKPDVAERMASAAVAALHKVPTSLSLPPPPLGQTLLRETEDQSQHSETRRPGKALCG